MAQMSKSPVSSLGAPLDAVGEAMVHCAIGRSQITYVARDSGAGHRRPH